jgi:hypothetical protein
MILPTRLGTLPVPLMTQHTEHESQDTKSAFQNRYPRDIQGIPAAMNQHYYGSFDSFANLDPMSAHFFFKVFCCYFSHQTLSGLSFVLFHPFQAQNVTFGILSCTQPVVSREPLLLVTTRCILAGCRVLLYHLPSTPAFHIWCHRKKGSKNRTNHILPL